MLFLRECQMCIRDRLGDGECQEGQIWESFMAAAHYKLDNLTIIIDNNGCLLYTS